jgi:hypothetical protein
VTGLTRKPEKKKKAKFTNTMTRDTGTKSDDPHFSRLFSLISLLIVLVTIALHFGLVSEGHWAIDEFLVVRTYKDSGWEAFADRLMEWSPRPISEALLWAYASLVNWQHKPLIGVFLGSLCLSLFLAPIISILQIRKKFSEESPGPLRSLLLFAFTPIAFFLLGHSLGELFFWPVGAAAYLTTLSAITLCFFQLAFGLTENPAGRLIASLALLFAAGASETGAFFSVVFCGLFLIGFTTDLFRRTSAPRKILWCLIPALVGIGVFGLLVQNRLRSQQAAITTAEFHSLYSSLKAGFGETLKECLVAGQRLSSRGLLSGVLLKVCYFAGIRYCWLSSGLKMPRKQALIVFAVSLIATIYFSLAASYYGYGISTNDRHHQLRQCLIILLLTTVALLSCHYHAATLHPRRSESMGDMFVLIALLLVVPQRLGALKHDYENYSVCIRNRSKSWDSGLSDGDSMTWFLPPQGRVAGTYVIPPGTYDLESESPACAQPMMQFFGKRHLEIRPFLGKAK